MRSPTEPISRPLRAAVIGTGFMAAVHSRAIHASGAELVGIVGTSPEKAARAAAEHRANATYGSLPQLLEQSRPDVVHVCTPNADHYAHAVEVIAAGVHVVCEKPLATSVEQAEAITVLAADAGVVATVPFVYRFHPMIREARARIRSGHTGDIRLLLGVYLQDWMVHAGAGGWRSDPTRGGQSRAFADIGSHLVDLIEFTTGHQIVDLTATANWDGGADESVSVLVTTDQGGTGVLQVSQVAPGRKNHLRFELSGTKETLVFSQEQPESLWVGAVDGITVLQRDGNQTHPDAQRYSRVPAGHPQGYQDAFNAFVADTYAAIAGADPDGLPRFVDGARAVALTSRVMASAWT